MMRVIQCDACAGSIAYDAAEEVAACLFCGSVAVEPSDLEEDIRAPDDTIPFAVARSVADEAFGRWARASWWYPKQIRGLRAELRAVLLPAWRFDAVVETHWAGLTRALTRSGVRPVSGVAQHRGPIVVPASMGVTEAELTALGPFDEAAASASDDLDAIPREVPSITEQAAERRARTIASEAHRKALEREHRLRRCHGSSLLTVEGTRLLMLPIWIGSFRYRDLAYRFVINGQSGRVTGKAPLDRVKLIAVTLVAVAFALALLWWRGRQ